MSNTSGLYQCVPTQDTLISTTQAAITTALTANGGVELSMNGGAGTEHILEMFQRLVYKATYELVLSTPQYYFYSSSLQPSSLFLIVGPAGMDVLTQTQPEHGRLELLLDNAGQIVQAGTCFVTQHTFHKAALLNPPNQL